MSCDCKRNKKSLEERMSKIFFSGKMDFSSQRKIIDEFFMAKAKEISLGSTCKKRQIGCVMVSPNGIVSGANGAPEKIGTCKVCSRIDAASGTQLKKCYAVHAEVRMLVRCARKGLSAKGGFIYLYGSMPCKDCLLALIEAGIQEIVCEVGTYYDPLSKEIFNRWIAAGGKLTFMEN